MLCFKYPKWLGLVLDYFMLIDAKIYFERFEHTDYMIYLMKNHKNLDVLIRINKKNNNIIVDFSNYDICNRVVIKDSHERVSIIKRLKSTTKFLLTGD